MTWTLGMVILYPDARSSLRECSSYCRASSMETWPRRGWDSRERRSFIVLLAHTPGSMGLDSLCGGNSNKFLMKTVGARLLPLRSEEHTSELQSPCNLVGRRLLAKQKTCSAARAPW